uniref:AAA family ATPase n=1 Tax=Roseiarcus sp. TaxID=1969460 RepID=UPI003F9BDF99
MEIGDWLRGLGLSQYEAAFRENSIDLEILRKLTSEDIKDLGVASVGHRRRLLAAIEALSSTGLATLAVAGSAAGIAEATSAERRHLTVMIVDLVGSTVLAARLDPEDMRDVLAAYHTCCAGLIASNGGFVAKHMGDGVLAYFGYPQAHEQDAENAVRAALAIVAAAPKLNTAAGAPLHARVGVATGNVVVGDLLGSGEAQERGVVGDTPNLAARLQGIAEPDGVVIDEGTRELLGNLFELQDLGTREGDRETRAGLGGAGREPGRQPLEALHGTALTPLVGREEECELLLRRWARAKDGEGQVVLLSGEAGIGKSRLAVSLVERLAGEPLTLPRYFCSPQHTDDALFPIIGEMERAARFARDDTLQAKLDKLDALLKSMSTPAEDAALFAEMLSLKPDGRYPAIDLAPPLRRQRTLQALVAQIEALTRARPVLIIFEDAHWSDPTSLEALSRVVDRIRSLRALMIVTFRPEFEAPWIGQSHVTTLILNRLAERDIGVMIGAVAGVRPLPATIRRDIVERSDGVPLFVEEMTKAVLETEGGGKAEGNRSLTVPATLQASLMARLDRLGPAKEVAQVAAAIGRESSHSLLVLVANLAEPDLNVALDHLVRAGLLSRRGIPPDATYLFKHALLQDLAHGALLREPRRVLHLRIAQALEAHFPDVVQSQPQVLARHCAEAGLFEKAATLWGRAGRTSMERSAVVEAEFQFSQALAQIAELPSSAALRREQIRLQAGLI